VIISNVLFLIKASGCELIYSAIIFEANEATKNGKEAVCQLENLNSL
jgi:hypothetical protein